jgi:PD-(D/E)XK endonuclease
VLTPSQKGSIAEAAIVAAAVKLGISVFKPVNEGLRYDLIFELGGTFVRVQCKWIVRRGDVLVVPFVSRHRCVDGFVQKRYTMTEIDAFTAYSLEFDKCYFLPFDWFPQSRAASLRLGPAMNNQQRGINWAEEYEFGATLGTLGAIAQLGERVHGMHEVAGSSPAGSTGLKLSSRPADAGLMPFRNAHQSR